jgi:sporulation protein YpjB
MFFKGLWKKNVLVVSAFALIALLTGCHHDEQQTDRIAVPSKEQVSKIERLNRLADDMYNKVMQGDVSGGREALRQMNDQITQIHFEGITSVEGMNALTETMTHAMRVLNAVKFSPDEGKASVSKLRLAVDALQSQHDPMWLQYDKVLENDIGGLEKAVMEADRAEALKAFAQLVAHYGMIHPSLLISRSPTVVEKMDSLIAFIKSQLDASSDPFKGIISVLPEVRRTVAELFNKKETPAYLPIVENEKPVIWSIWIASSIIAALVYAGWRLFQKERGVQSVRKTDES